MGDYRKSREYCRVVAVLMEGFTCLIASNRLMENADARKVESDAASS